MTALTLGLLASMSWGVADFLGGLAARDKPVLAVAVGAQAVGLVPVAALAVVLGVHDEPRAVGVALLAGVATSVGILSLYRGLAIGPVTIVATIATTGVLIPVIVGFAQGERPTALESAGMALTLCGVLLVTRDRPLGEELHMTTKRAIAFALITATLGIGPSLVALEYAAENSSATSAVFWARLGTLLVLSAAALIKVLPLARILERPRFPVAIGLADSSGVICFTLATTVGLLSLVSILASLFPVVTIALAYFVLGERVRRIQQAGAIAVFAGIVLISGG